MAQGRLALLLICSAMAVVHSQSYRPNFQGFSSEDQLCCPSRTTVQEAAKFLDRYINACDIALENTTLESSTIGIAYGMNVMKLSLKGPSAFRQGFGKGLIEDNKDRDIKDIKDNPALNFAFDKMGLNGRRLGALLDAYYLGIEDRPAFNIDEALQAQYYYVTNQLKQEQVRYQLDDDDLINFERNLKAIWDIEPYPACQNGSELEDGRRRSLLEEGDDFDAVDVIPTQANTSAHVAYRNESELNSFKNTLIEACIEQGVFSPRGREYYIYEKAFKPFGLGNSFTPDLGTFRLMNQVANPTNEVYFNNGGGRCMIKRYGDTKLPNDTRPHPRPVAFDRTFSSMMRMMRIMTRANLADYISGFFGGLDEETKKHLLNGAKIQYFLVLSYANMQQSKLNVTDEGMEVLEEIVGTCNGLNDTELSVCGVPLTGRFSESANKTATRNWICMFDRVSCIAGTVPRIGSSVRRDPYDECKPMYSQCPGGGVRLPGFPG